MTEYKTTRINPSRSAPLKFKGRLLAETEWEVRQGYMRFEVWETEGGALIAVSEGSIEGTDARDIRATVVECPILNSEDLMLEHLMAMRTKEMRWAVMDHFDWHARARSMVKAIGWKLLREVA